LRFPGRAPRVPSAGRFGRNTTRNVDHPQAAMGSHHRPGTAPGLAGDRPPPFATGRSNSDHAGYSGEIESLD